jgi:hypothetical protein
MLAGSAMSQRTYDSGTIFVHAGTIGFYASQSLGYESRDFLRGNYTHSVSAFAAAGRWHSAITQDNAGFQWNLGAAYALCFGSHAMEHRSLLAFHYDQSLKSNGLAYLGCRYKTYVGYRLHFARQRMVLRVGAGWPEFVQAGLGYRIALGKLN